MKTIPKRNLGDKVQVANTATAEELGLKGKSGIVVSIVGPGKYYSDIIYLIEQDNGCPFVCPGCCLTGFASGENP